MPFNDMKRVLSNGTRSEVRDFFRKLGRIYTIEPRYFVSMFEVVFKHQNLVAMSELVEFVRRYFDWIREEFDEYSSVVLTFASKPMSPLVARQFVRLFPSGILDNPEHIEHGLVYSIRYHSWGQFVFFLDKFRALKGGDKGYEANLRLESGRTLFVQICKSCFIEAFYYIWEGPWERNLDDIDCLLSVWLCDMTSYVRGRYTPWRKVYMPTYFDDMFGPVETMFSYLVERRPPSKILCRDMIRECVSYQQLRLLDKFRLHLSEHFGYSFGWLGNNNAVRYLLDQGMIPDQGCICCILKSYRHISFTEIRRAFEIAEHSLGDGIGRFEPEFYSKCLADITDVTCGHYFKLVDFLIEERGAKITRECLVHIISNGGFFPQLLQFLDRYGLGEFDWDLEIIRAAINSNVEVFKLVYGYCHPREKFGDLLEEAFRRCCDKECIKLVIDLGVCHLPSDLSELIRVYIRESISNVDLDFWIRELGIKVDWELVRFALDNGDRDTYQTIMAHYVPAKGDLPLVDGSWLDDFVGGAGYDDLDIFELYMELGATPTIDHFRMLASYVGYTLTYYQKGKLLMKYGVKPDDALLKRFYTKSLIQSVWNKKYCEMAEILDLGIVDADTVMDLPGEEDKHSRKFALSLLMHSKCGIPITGYYNRFFYRHYLRLRDTKIIMKRNLKCLVKQYIYAPHSRFYTEQLELLHLVTSDEADHRAEHLRLRQYRNGLIDRVLLNDLYSQDYLITRFSQVPFIDGGIRDLIGEGNPRPSRRQMVHRLPTRVLEHLLEL